ncbi:MAG: sterol desaturase family protein [Alphaproteobacteria bacterium]|nr:sterol desaturase family protein [Alphaproteobacteria bacterium]
MIDGWRILWDMAVPLAFFFAAGALFAAGERWRPLRSVDKRSGRQLDIIGFAVTYGSGGLFLAVFTEFANSIGPDPLGLATLPWIISIPLFFLVTDLLRYWAHWAMHSQRLWAIHRFHHSVAELYWFSGNRDTAAHTALLIVPSAVFAWLMDMPAVVAQFNLLLQILWNHVMHCNIALPAALSRAIETVVVTPRLHELHHSLLPALRDRNFGSVFSFWDRLFGTYVPPDSVDRSGLGFGLEPQDRTPPLRMVLGL